MKQKYGLGMMVRALCDITEGGGEHNKTPDYEATDFRGNLNYVHAKKGELGEIMIVDDGCPTVRFLRTKTATIVGDHEIEILK